MRITMIMGNTPKIDTGWTRPLRGEFAGRPEVAEHLRDERTRGPGGPGGGASGGLLARGSTPRDVPRDDGRVDVLQHGLARDHDALHVLAARHLVHHRLQDLFQDGAQAARAGAAEVRLVGDGLQRVGGEFQVHAVQFEQAPVLLHQGIARLGEDLDQCFAVQVVHAGDDREAADEFGNHPELQQVLRHHLAELVGVRVPDPQDGVEAHPVVARALLDDLLQAREGPAADEQHVGGVDLDELLVRVLAPALRRYRGGGALEDLQQRLLDALAGDVAGDRRVLALARDLVDLVDVDDAGLGLLDVVVRRLDQLEQDVLDVFADVAGLGQGSRVGDRERHVEQAGQRLGEQRLAGPGRAEQQDVGLGQLDALIARAVFAGLDALVVVVHGHRQGLLGLVLADHVRVEELVDLPRLGQAVPLELGGLGELFLDDLVAEVDALVAYVHARAGDELLDLLLTLTAERALQQVPTVTDACHPDTPLHGAAATAVLAASSGHVPRGRQALAYRRYRLLGPDGHHQTPSAAREEELNSPGKDDTTSTARSLPLLIMVRTSSMMPYSLASSAVRNLSRSMSRRIFSSSWPVCLARMASMAARIRRISLAWISMSLDWP